VGTAADKTVPDYISYPVSNPRFKHLLESKNLIFYTAYVDEISFMYDIAAIDPDLVITSMNHLHQIFLLNRTLKNNEKINFLDLLLVWKKVSLVKLLFIENLPSQKTTFNFFSNQPIEHKISGYRYSQSTYVFTPPFTDTKEKDVTP